MKLDIASVSPNVRPVSLECAPVAVTISRQCASEGSMISRRADYHFAPLQLVDADPQGSAQAWSNAREEPPLFPVIGMAKPSLHRDLPDMAKDYDVTVIDGAPRVSELGRAAILASDFVLIPVQPSPFDVWATDEIVRLIQEAQQFKPNIRAAFAINRRIVNTAIGRDVMEAFAGLPFPVLPQVVGQRVIFAETAARGLTVAEAAPKSEAAREIAALANAILNPPEGSLS